MTAPPPALFSSSDQAMAIGRTLLLLVWAISADAVEDAVGLKSSSAPQPAGCRFNAISRTNISLRIEAIHNSQDVTWSSQGSKFSAISVEQRQTYDGDVATFLKFNVVLPDEDTVASWSRWDYSDGTSTIERCVSRPLEPSDLSANLMCIGSTASAQDCLEGVSFPIYNGTVKVGSSTAQKYVDADGVALIVDIAGGCIPIAMYQAGATNQIFFQNFVLGSTLPDGIFDVPTECNVAATASQFLSVRRPSSKLGWLGWI